MGEERVTVGRHFVRLGLAHRLGSHYIEQRGRYNGFTWISLFQSLVSHLTEVRVKKEENGSLSRI